MWVGGGTFFREIQGFFKHGARKFHFVKYKKNLFFEFGLKSGSDDPRVYYYQSHCRIFSATLFEIVEFSLDFRVF